MVKCRLGRKVKNDEVKYWNNALLGFCEFLGTFLSKEKVICEASQSIANEQLQVSSPVVGVLDEPCSMLS
jgi:hypothetical protein